MAEFKTPNSKKVSRPLGEDSTSTPKIVIPPSPLMKQLGYGTGETYSSKNIVLHHIPCIINLPPFIYKIH